MKIKDTTMKIIKRFLFIVLSILLLGCNGSGINGTYYFVQSENTTNLLTMGREIGCSLIGKLEFRNGKCYLRVMGAEKRLDYSVDNGVIYLKGYDGKGEVGITIIDNNTIDFQGCIFQKKKTLDLEQNTNEESKNIESISSSKKITNAIVLSRDSYDFEAATIEDIKVVENEVYIVVDVVQIKYFGDDESDFTYEVINENPKLRTYKVNAQTSVTNEKCKSSKGSYYFTENRERILKNIPFGFYQISTNSKGLLTAIDLGCWN